MSIDIYEKKLRTVQPTAEKNVSVPPGNLEKIDLFANHLLDNIDTYEKGVYCAVIDSAESRKNTFAAGVSGLGTRSRLAPRGSLEMRLRVECHERKSL